MTRPHDTESSTSELTLPEHEVRRRLARGSTILGAAQKQNYGPSTIRRDTTIVNRKLGAANRPSAVNRARPPD